VPRWALSRQTAPSWTTRRCSSPNAQDFRRRALAAADQQDGLRWFVLNVEATVEVDFTALESLDALREEITQRGAIFALARVKQDLLVRLEAFGLAEKIGADRLFPTLPTAVDAYERWVGDHGAEDHGAEDHWAGDH
jgi:sulfate permease, SulP family